jgi:hypothetical protein
MEILSLVLAVPAVVMANICYGVLLRFGLIRFKMLRPWLLWPSRLVLLLAAMDVTAVAFLGAVPARRLIGPAFWGIHLLVVLLGAPALANVLILRSQGMWFRRWYGVVALCSVFGIFLVFFQVGVGDALYGPDGVGGPFAP